MPREVDFEEPGRQEGQFRTQLWLSRHPMYVCVLGSDLEAPEEVQGLIGLTPDELGLCQSLDADVAFVFAWLEGEVEPEEGELFLASLAVKNYHITGTCFSWIITKSSGKSRGRRERSGFWWLPGSSGRESSGCAMTFRQPDTRG